MTWPTEINDGYDANHTEANMITGGESFYGGKRKCHTAVSEGKVVKAIKAISNWKAPRPDFPPSFWSVFSR